MESTETTNIALHSPRYVHESKWIMRERYEDLPHHPYPYHDHNLPSLAYSYIQDYHMLENKSPFKNPDVKSPNAIKGILGSFGTFIIWDQGR